MATIKFVADRASTPDPILSAWKNFDPKDEPFSNYDFLPWFQAAKMLPQEFEAKFIDTKHKCNCSIQMLMREGCKCGGE